MRQLHPRAILCLILAALIAQAPLKKASAQFDDQENLFDNEVEAPLDQNGQFGAGVPAPPPPPPPGDFGAPPPSTGLPGDNAGSPPPGAFSPGGLGSSTSKGFGSGSQSLSAKPLATKKTDPNRPPLADAGLEDITNANYPDLIESFDYPNAEITDLVKAISQLTGKNFIIDPGVRGKISIVAPTQITVAEAYKAFLTALAINGFTVVPSGKFLKIKSARNAQRDSIQTYSGEYFPNSDAMITRIIHLKHLSVEEVNKRLRILPSKDGEMTAYEPTNSLIISDYGANMERIMKILNDLDVPGFEEQLAVMPIRYAKAKDLADLINQIINKNPTKGGAATGGFGGAPGFGGGVPTFRGRGGPNGSGTPEELSLVAPDDRTNAIIVVGNKAGVEKVRALVKKLDYKLDPSEAGNVFVYHVKFGEAEKIATTLNGLTTGTSGGAAGGAGGFPGGGFPGGGFGNQGRANPNDKQAVFGGDVKITFDKNTNSLVISASKQDYETVLSLLKKLDIPKDQVFVEAIIMEMNSNKSKAWNPTYYSFNPESGGIGRAGFSSGNVQNILNPAADSGGILGFGLGKTFQLQAPGVTGAAGAAAGAVGGITIPSLLAFINIIQQNTEANVLSTPQILALDNETASIEVGDKLPIGNSTTTATGGAQTNAPVFEQVSIKLEITPFISPDSDMVRLKIDQSVKQPTTNPAVGDALAKSTTSISDRSIKTNLVIHNGDTAVLGGLAHDQEQVQERKVPVLGDIPVIGWLFKSRNVEAKKVNLIVFLTPKIIRSMRDSHNVLSKKMNDRVDWLKKNFDGRDPYGKIMDSLPRAAQSDPDETYGGGKPGPDSIIDSTLRDSPSDAPSEREPQALRTHSSRGGQKTRVQR